MTNKIALEKAIDFIESLTREPLLLPDDIEMTLGDVQRHARTELASIRKVLDASPQSKADIDQAVAVERERCARIAEGSAQRFDFQKALADHDDLEYGRNGARIDIARAIREGFAPPAPQEHVATDPALLGIAEEMKESGGHWQPCTGCYDTEDGHPTQKYDYSPALQTDVGCGCHECGGLGAVWWHMTEAELASYVEDMAAIDDDAIDAIQRMMDKKGLTRKDVFPAKSRASECMSRKRPLSIAMIRKLHFEHGIPAEVLIAPYRAVTEGSTNEV